MTEYIKNYFSSSLKTFSILKTRILTKKCEKSKKYSKSIILYDSKKNFFSVSLNLLLHVQYRPANCSSGAIRPLMAPDGPLWPPTAPDGPWWPPTAPDGPLTAPDGPQRPPTAPDGPRRPPTAPDGFLRIFNQKNDIWIKIFFRF